ncbi:MAG: NAD(P)H-hydrate dehydratase [Leifsonia xyli]|nr:MAG: NAD(P)H-hydrate dehydratase [Leifsonia xyli]
MPTSSESGGPEASVTEVTPELLRDWGLPDGGESKYSRGQVLVVGGDARSPGAARLAGEAALRVGAGRLTVAIAASVAPQFAVALPECGVVPLAERRGHIDGAAAASAIADDLDAADAVLVGPGLDDIDETAALLGAYPDADAVAVLDAYALGALARDPALRRGLPERLILTPNLDEAELLLGGELDELAVACATIARRLDAVVACYGSVAAPDGRTWRAPEGSSGLGTSGSGDVLAGAVAGLAARGVEPARAAVWGSYLHAVAGERLGARIGTLGYLARELPPELPRALAELGF